MSRWGDALERSTEVSSRQWAIKALPEWRRFLVWSRIMFTVLGLALTALDVWFTALILGGEGAVAFGPAQAPMAVFVVVVLGGCALTTVWMIGTTRRDLTEKEREAVGYRLGDPIGYRPTNPRALRSPPQHEPRPPFIPPPPPPTPRG